MRRKKAEILASAAAGEKGKKKKRERFLVNSWKKGRRFRGSFFWAFRAGT